MMIETTFMKFGKVLQKLLGKQQIQEPYRYGQRVSKNAMSTSRFGRVTKQG